ncbi:MAG: hypothetical protein ACLVAW_27845 [Eisenbergiella massiliensis]
MDDEKIIELFWNVLSRPFLKLRINMGASAGKSHGISWEMKRMRRSVNDTYLEPEQHPPRRQERCGPIYAESPGIRR